MSRLVRPEAQLTPAQRSARDLLAGPAGHVLLYGGSRSGKTVLILRCLVLRALKAKSRHAVLRFRLAHLRASILQQSWPQVMAKWFAAVPWHLDKSDLVARIGRNGSEVWFGGLDDQARTEKILGQEYSTIFLNEVSQIAYRARLLALTRLAEPSGLRLREWCDCNPPSRGHWSHSLFLAHTDPDTGRPHPHPDDYAATGLNPADNPHLPAEYLRELDALPVRERLRFRDGVWADATPNALWPLELLAGCRYDGELPQLRRVVVAVDPSGAGGDDGSADAIGIVVAGLGADGCVYVLEDATVLAGPAGWARTVASAYERHQADLVVAEVNYGGAMVGSTIRTALPNVRYQALTASRGKVVRAEPIAALYEQGKVWHACHCPQLESELSGFSTGGYTGMRSPNRADALVWAVSALYPGVVRRGGDLAVEDLMPRHRHSSATAGAWMM